MADPHPPLTLADQVMVNATLWLILTRDAGSSDAKAVEDILREVLPDCSEDHPFAGDVAEAARDLLANASRAGPLRARHFLARFAYWRMALAWDRYRKIRGDKT